MASRPRPRHDRSSLKADIRQREWHVRYVPCVDGSWLARGIFTSHCWSVQPCVRPISAVRMTVGIMPSADRVPCQKRLGIADHGECTGGEQAAQIAIALLADTAKLVAAPARALLRHEPDPG
jgi:hypothetical protein